MPRIVAFPRALDRARELPELRAALMTSTEEGGIIEQAEFQRLLSEAVGDDSWKHTTREHNRFIVGPKGYGPDEMPGIIDAAVRSAKNNTRWYHDNLPHAQLIHVTEHMCEFIRQAADSVPPSLTIHRDDAPAPVGLVVFQTPMIGIDAGPVAVGTELLVHGLMWAHVNLPDRTTPWFVQRASDVNGLEGISIASLTYVEGDGTLPQRWIPLGRTDWPWGDTVNDSTMKEAIPDWNEEKQASFEEDRRLLAAVWATINQKLLIDTEIVFPDKHATKRLERAGHGDLDNKITIVHLRKTEYRALGTEEGSGQTLKWRTPVRKHFKRQPYGPGRRLRKIIVIMPYWRGPEDAPIRHTERIWEVDR